MSTSGTYNFSLNMTKIITRAFQMINVNDPNKAVSADDYSFAADLLNMMLKHWEVKYVHLWKRKQGYLFPAIGQNSYQVGSVSGADNVTNAYVSTTLSVNASASNTITCTSVTGMNVNDNIGIELNNGIRQWTTISSINTGTLTITLATNLSFTSTAANTVITYTNKLNRPLRILRATTLDLKSNNNEVTMQDISFDDYFSFPVKSNQGRPNNFYYDRVTNNTLPYTGTLYIYPQPQLVCQIMVFTYVDSFQDMINGTDNMDLPQEWLLPTCANLALTLAKWGYGKFIEVQNLQATVDAYLADIENFDSDDSSLTLSPNTQDWKFHS